MLGKDQEWGHSGNECPVGAECRTHICRTAHLRSLPSINLDLVEFKAAVTLFEKERSTLHAIFCPGRNFLQGKAPYTETILPVDVWKVASKCT